MRGELFKLPRIFYCILLTLLSVLNVKKLTVYLLLSG